jgi:PT repeat
MPTDTPLASTQQTAGPTIYLTSQPAGQSTRQPSSQPTWQPSSQPTRQPSSQPTRQPSSQPTWRPSSQPTWQPSSQPTWQPSSQPTGQPTSIPSQLQARPFDVSVKALESSNSGVLYGSLFAVLVSCSLLLFYCYRLRRKYDDDRLTAFVGSLLDEGDVSLIIGGRGRAIK